MSRQPLAEASRRQTLTAANAVMFGVLTLVVGPVARVTYGSAVISQVLFGTACIACVAVLLRPRVELLRVLSGAVVGLAFAWRATSVALSWLTGGVGSLYGVVLYVGLATVFIIGWADMLPVRPQFEERIARLGRPDAE